MAGELQQCNLSNQEILQKKLDEALTSDFETLATAVASRNEQKRRNWPSLVVGIVMAALISTPLWFLWEPTEWWTTAIFIGLAGVAALFAILGLVAWFKPPTERNQ
ncbi:MAG: hypothetical protein ACR2GH_10175 [Pseudonocardia sp.]